MLKGSRVLNALWLACALGAFAVFVPSAAQADSVVVVSPGNMGSWTFLNRDGGTANVKTPTTGSMVNGPATPPAGTGSANLTLPANNGGDDSALRSTGFSGTQLTSITALQYSTYDTANNGQQFPYFGLVVSADHGASVFDTIFFEPPYQTPGAGNPALPNQGAPVLNTWQTWDALHGAWWDNNGLSLAGSGPGHSLSFNDLLAAMAANAGVNINDLTIVNALDDNNVVMGGVRFDVGFADSGPAYNGNIDGFKIGINGVNTTYDFEATVATPLPAALPLFATGLAGLGFLARRRRKQTA